MEKDKKLFVLKRSPLAQALGFFMIL